MKKADQREQKIDFKPLIKVNCIVFVALFLLFIPIFGIATAGQIILLSMIISSIFNLLIYLKMLYFNSQWTKMMIKEYQVPKDVDKETIEMFKGLWFWHTEYDIVPNPKYADLCQTIFKKIVDTVMIKYSQIPKERKGERRALYEVAQHFGEVASVFEEEMRICALNNNNSLSFAGFAFNGILDESLSITFSFPSTLIVTRDLFLEFLKALKEFDPKNDKPEDYFKLFLERFKEAKKSDEKFTPNTISVNIVKKQEQGQEEEETKQ